MSGLVCHYTVGIHFARIAESGVIRPAVTGVPAGERPAVWFSKREPWEPTANKMWPNPDGSRRSLNMRETAELCGGLVRIGISREIAHRGWREYLAESGVAPGMARGLVRAAKAQKANPLDWFVCFAPVPRMLWSTVDVWQDGKWVRAWTAELDKAA